MTHFRDFRESGHIRHSSEDTSGPTWTKEEKKPNIIFMGCLKSLQAQTLNSCSQNVRFVNDLDPCFHRKEPGSVDELKDRSFDEFLSPLTEQLQPKCHPSLFSCSTNRFPTADALIL